MADSSKHARALAMRDLGLSIVHVRGACEPVRVANAPDFAVRVPLYRDRDLMIIHRTPEATSILRQFAAQPMRPNRRILSNALHIWSASENVLTIEWDDEGAVKLDVYKPGDWERRLSGGEVRH